MPRGRTQIATRDEQALVIERFTKGEPAAQIALDMTWPHYRVYALLKRNGLNPAQNSRRVQPGRWEAMAEEIIRLYQTPMHTRHVARVMGASYGSVRRILADRGLLRDDGHAHQFSNDQLAQILARWDSGISQTAIAREMSCSQASISRLIAKHGRIVETRRLKRERHGSWKGGRIKDALGYVHILVPRDHPLYDGLANADGYCREHRLVMSELLGRPLLKSETVHHKNGIKDDNRPENLQLRTGRHGKHEAWICLDCGSHNIAAVAIADPPSSNA